MADRHASMKQDLSFQEFVRKCRRLKYGGLRIDGRKIAVAEVLRSSGISRTAFDRLCRTGACREFVRRRLEPVVDALIDGRADYSGERIEFLSLAAGSW